VKLLDLFSGAGGAAMGYYRAGFTEIVGVDIEPMKRYPFQFVQDDALEYLAGLIESGDIAEFDLIHASPPCQVYSVTAHLSSGDHPNLVEPTRELLLAAGKPYVIENVPGAPLQNPLTLCGTMFGLRVIRHRLFECRPPIWFPPAACHHWSRIGENGFVCAVGGGSGNSNNYPAHSRRVGAWQRAMGIDWMVKTELSQAIPPAYTEFIGRRIMQKIKEVMPDSD
jgi:DNA (cytosine-5)-methyltransferase 1